MLFSDTHLQRISVSQSSLEITDTCVVPFISSGYSQSKCIPMASAVRKEASYLSGPEDSEDTKYDKRKKYDLWRYEYPMNEARETSERLRMLRKKEQLEQELRELNDKLDSGHE